MNKQVSALLTAFLALALVTFVGVLTKESSNQLVRGPGLQSELDLETDIELSSAESETELEGLTVDFELPRRLRIGSQAELLHIELLADGPYTLRYLTVQLGIEGLQESAWQDASNWQVYEKGRPAQIGRGESFSDGQLRVRLEPERGLGFHGEVGKTELVLKTLALQESDDVNLQVSLPREGWEWTPGHYIGSWLHLENLHHGDELNGLPSEPLEKKY